MIEIKKDIAEIGQADGEMRVVLPTPAVMAAQAHPAQYADRKSETHEKLALLDGGMSGRIRWSLYATFSLRASHLTMICPQQQCIFIHVPKTAGQSVEHVFLHLAGLSWKSREALLLKPNDDPAKGPPRLAHLKAREYVQYGYVTQAEFEAAFTFAFVRNPWARMVSLYHHLNRGQSFRAYVLGEFRSRVWQQMAWFVGPQSDFLCDETGELLVDFVGRFERLQSDFDEVCRRLRLPPTPLPRVNRAEDHRRLHWKAHPRTMLRSWRRRLGKSPLRFSRYQDYYDLDTRELVAELYQTDIALFDYRFDETE